MKTFPQTDYFSSALTTALDYATYGGADISECLRATESIRSGDRESWHLAWIDLADRTRRQATQDLSHGRETEARETFLRSAHYYRTAGLFLERSPDDARIATTAEASGACFATAMRLFAPICEIMPLEIESSRCTAYLHRASGNALPKPTLLVIGEAGATPLDLYFSCAIAANRSGWHCLTVSGGQGNPLMDLAEKLLSTVEDLDSVDRGCLGLLTFQREPVLPPQSGCRRLGFPWAMGSRDEVTKRLRLHADRGMQTGQEIFEAVGTLGLFHQKLSRWLEDAE
jgi:hypothetical protein